MQNLKPNINTQPPVTIVGQLLEMDETTLAQLLVRCKKTKFLKPPKGKTEEERTENYKKIEDEFNQEVNNLLQTYTKYGLVKELMAWATGYTYDEIYNYVQHEFELLKRAGGFYNIKPRQTETLLEFERVIFEHWLNYIIGKLRKELEKHPEKFDEIAKSLDKHLKPEEKEQLLKVLKEKGLVGKEIATLQGKALLNAILTAGSGAGLILGLSSAGFAVYLALTKTIHLIFTQLLGITLPFVIYTTATRALSLFLGPLGWIIFTILTIIPFITQARKKKTALLATVFVPSIYLAHIEKQLQKGGERER